MVATPGPKLHSSHRVFCWASRHQGWRLMKDVVNSFRANPTGLRAQEARLSRNQPNLLSHDAPKKILFIFVNLQLTIRLISCFPSSHCSQGLWRPRGGGAAA